MKIKQKHIVRFILATALVSGFIFVVASCKKIQEPNPVSPPTGPTVTIQQLRNMFVGISIPFTSNTILHAVVTCDEVSGNLYKQVYIRDNSGAFATTHNYGAISVHFSSGTNGFLTTGDSIAINLNGCTLDKSGGGSLQIDSAVTTKQGQITKLGLASVVPQPIVTTISQIDTFINTAGGGFVFDGQLVQLNNVEFIKENVGTSYAIPQAPPAPPQNVNKYINDFAGNTMVAYNSGYANFAGQTIPANSGTITAIANLYTTMQLTIRSFSDVQLTNAYQQIRYDVIAPMPPAFAYTPFMYQALLKNNPAVMAGWTTIAYEGGIVWQGGQYGNPNTSNGNPPNWTYHPAASNYQTADVINDMWLISPPIVDHGGTKYVDFSTALQYGTNKRLLSVLVSRTFNGTNIDPSQWQDISVDFPGIATNSTNGSSPGLIYAAHTVPTFSAGVIVPNPTGINVGGSSAEFYIAFRYRSNTAYSDSTGSTYLIGALALHN